MKKADIHKRALSDFKDSATAEYDNRENFLNDVKFENGDQWSDEEISQRVGRPCLVVNKIAGAVKQTVGEARKNRPRIKVKPVDDVADPFTAEVFTGLIRNIENVSCSEDAYDKGHEDAVRGGFGYWRIITDYTDDDAFDQDIKIKRIVNPLSVYFDQSATDHSYQDAEYAFVVDSMTKTRFEKEFPKATPVSFEQSRGEEESGWFSKDTVRVAEYFYKVKKKKQLFQLVDGRTIEVTNPVVYEEEEMKLVRGDGMTDPKQYVRSKVKECDQIMWAKLNGIEVLEGPREWPGKYIPIIPCLGEEVWIEGKRILRSVVRHALDAQKIYNWSRSNTIETLALAPKQPYHVTPDEIEGHEDQWNKSHANPQAYRYFNDVGLGRPQPSTPSVPNTGAYREAMTAADDIKATTGIFDASLGAQGNETSGRAISERKQQGSTATFVFMDNLAKAIKYTGKVLVDLIPKIYDSTRVVRLLNDEGKEVWAKINEEDPVTGKKIHDLSIGKYDVVFDIGPNYATKRQEAAEGLMTVVQTAPQYMPIVMPEIAKNLDWPGADELGKKLEQANQPQGPPPDLQIKLQIEQIKLQTAQLKAQSEQMNKVFEEKMGVIDLKMKSIDYEIKKVGLGEKHVGMATKELDLLNKAREPKPQSGR